jgi:hypothetical protein
MLIMQLLMLFHVLVSNLQLGEYSLIGCEKTAILACFRMFFHSRSTIIHPDLILTPGRESASKTT